MTRNIDELSNLRSEPPEQYFGKMRISKEQKAKRVEYTKKANDIFDLILVLLLTMDDKDFSMYSYLRDRLESELLSLMNEYAEPDDYLIDYASDFAYNFIDVTRNNIENEWFTSSDRALYNAENCANDFHNYVEYRDAVMAGKTHKKWLAEPDNKVRESHQKVDGKKIPIREFFRVGLSRMRFPKDYEFASAFPRELINCRCGIEYLPKDKENKEKLYRKEDNIGSYSKLEESMTLKHVKNVVAEMGLDDIKVKYKIERQPDTIGLGIYGSTADNGYMISLFPDAFTNREQLVKTLAHEHIHLNQFRTRGKINLDSDDILERENEAVLAEEPAWNEYVKRTGYRR